MYEPMPQPVVAHQPMAVANHLYVKVTQINHEASKTGYSPSQGHREETGQ
jgi:hypothetical protein